MDFVPPPNEFELLLDNGGRPLDSMGEVAELTAGVDSLLSGSPLLRSPPEDEGPRLIVALAALVVGAPKELKW